MRNDRRIRRTAGIVLALLGVLLAPRLAHAYVDPGTTQSIFAVLAPILALLGVFLGYLLWPFRYILYRIFGRKKKTEETAEKPAGEEASSPAADEPPKQE